MQALNYASPSKAHGSMEEVSCYLRTVASEDCCLTSEDHGLTDIYLLGYIKNIGSLSKMSPDFCVSAYSLFCRFWPSIAGTISFADLRSRFYYEESLILRTEFGYDNSVLLGADCAIQVSTARRRLCYTSQYFWAQVVLYKSVLLILGCGMGHLSSREENTRDPYPSAVRASYYIPLQGTSSAQPSGAFLGLTLLAVY